MSDSSWSPDTIFPAEIYYIIEVAKEAAHTYTCVNCFVVTLESSASEVASFYKEWEYALCEENNSASGRLKKDHLADNAQ